METPEAIYFLISGYLSGDATEEERASLMKALQDDPSLMQQFDLLQQLWAAGEPGKEIDLQNEKIRKILQLAAVEEVLEQPVAEMETAIPLQKQSRFRLWLAAAAIVTIIISTWAIFQQDHQPGISSTSEIVAHKGSRTRTLLPDGSIVWLNAGSTLSYDPAFDGPQREIVLNGEAFFDIAPVANRPFIVHAGNIDIQVLGTAFNVKSYADDHTVETTLLRGLVQLSRKDKPAAKPILLKPHQKLVLEKELKENNVNQEKDNAVRIPLQSVLQLDTTLRDDELPETAWIYNRLQFRGDGFPQLVKKLERWYNIKINFEDEAVQSLTFNGSLENETVEQAFRALQVAVPFSFTIKGNEIFIRSRTPAAP